MQATSQKFRKSSVYTGHESYVLPARFGRYYTVAEAHPSYSPLLSEGETSPYRTESVNRMSVCVCVCVFVCVSSKAGLSSCSYCQYLFLQSMVSIKVLNCCVPIRLLMLRPKSIILGHYHVILL